MSDYEKNDDDINAEEFVDEALNEGDKKRSKEELRALFVKLLAVVVSDSEHESTNALGKIKKIREKYGLSGNDVLEYAGIGSSSDDGKAKFDAMFEQLIKASRKQADILIDLALKNCALFHDADNTAYADIEVSGHRETWPLRRRGFRSWLGRLFYEETKGAPGDHAMQAAIGVLEAKAIYDGPEHKLAVRVGEHGGAIYIDLANDKWQAIKIAAEGWHVVDQPPVRFWRSSGMRPLPAPTRAGRLDTLRKIINVKNDHDFLLVVAWLLAAMRPRGPYPVLVLIGEAGTAKSTFVRILRALVDPNKAPLRSLSRDDRELFISATNTWVIGYDNVSSVPVWLSDGLCRIATGGGFATRSLSSDSDEALFDAMRPIILNGVENFVVRGDLADRSLTIALTPIAAGARRAEEEMWADIEDKLPEILGALCDAVSAGLTKLPSVKLTSMPRMADFARWGVAACPEIKTPSGTVTFWNAYAGNRADATETVLEADAVAQAIRTFMTGRDQWSGTATALLGLLNGITDEKVTKEKGWPGDGTRLSSRLTRVATAFRETGIDIRPRKGTNGRREISITRIPSPQPPEPGPDYDRDSAPPAPPAPLSNETNGLGEALGGALGDHTAERSATGSATAGNASASATAGSATASATASATGSATASATGSATANPLNNKDSGANGASRLLKNSLDGKSR